MLRTSRGAISCAQATTPAQSSRLFAGTLNAQKEAMRYTVSDHDNASSHLGPGGGPIGGVSKRYRRPQIFFAEVFSLSQR